MKEAIIFEILIRLLFEKMLLYLNLVKKDKFLKIKPVKMFNLKKEDSYAL